MCQLNDTFFIGNLPCHVIEIADQVERTDIRDGIVVSPNDIYPKFKSCFSLVPPELVSSWFVKRSSLLQCHPEKKVAKILMRQEASVLEELKNHPHPNLATYLGCLKRRDLVVGLCFEKFRKRSMTELRKATKALTLKNA